MSTKSNVTVMQDAPVSAQSESAAILNMIERAARDPSIDLDKMERLMAMRDKTRAQDAEMAFNEAMKATQAEMRTIGADAANSQTRSRYATYAKLDTVLRPIYTKHGFSLSFDEGDSPKEDHVRILCYVSHDAGHTRVYRKDMPADGKGAKGGDVMTKTHAAGAAASYGARYLLKGIFNVAVGDEDADGNPPPGDTITKTQTDTLIGLADEVGADKARFCTFFKIDGIAKLPANRFTEALTMLEAKRSK